MLSLRSMLVDNKKENYQPYQIVVDGGEGEYVEKKSRFIATVQPVETEEEAVAFIESISASIPSTAAIVCCIAGI